MQRGSTLARLAACTVSIAVVVTMATACGSNDTPGDAERPAATPDRAARASTSTDGGRRLSAAVAGGHVEGGLRREHVALGETVTIEVRSDVAETLHLHGYDLEAGVAAGGTGVLRFTADIPGVFEVELEHTRLEVLRLEVG